MTFKASTLRPGLLISLKTSLVGNVRYFTEELEAETRTEDGALTAKWATQRIINDPEEHERGTKARGKARGLVRAVCAETAFGLMCPEADKDKLDAALAAGRKVADEFNETATLSRVFFSVIIGRVASDDVEAVKAINAEVRDMLEDMQRGIKNCDVKVIREAAAKAKEMGQMLSPDAQARVTIAIEAARATAKKINAAGEAAAAEVDEATIRKIREVRTAFLDLEESAPAAVSVAPRRAVELSSEPAAPGKLARKAQARALEV